MDNQIHIHLHIADASSINLQDLIVQANGSAPAAVAVPARTRTFYVAVYRSMRQRFALGHKLYDDEFSAQRNRTHRNFHSVASFTVDLDTHEVTGFNGPGEGRYWALLQDPYGTFSLGRNSYTDLDDLDAEYVDRFATISGETNAQGQVSLAGA